MQKVDPAFCKKFEDGITYIRELEGIVAERKEKASQIVLIKNKCFATVYKTMMDSAALLMLN